MKVQRKVRIGMIQNPPSDHDRSTLFIGHNSQNEPPLLFQHDYPEDQWL